MSAKRFTSAERTGLILLGFAIAAAAVALMLDRNHEADLEQTTPVAIDSLIHELPEERHAKERHAPKPASKPAPAPRDPLADPF